MIVGDRRRAEIGASDSARRAPNAKPSTSGFASIRSDAKGKRQRSRQTPAISPGFPYSSTTGPITAARQERQIVQSWLNCLAIFRCAAASAP